MGHTFGVVHTCWYGSPHCVAFPVPFPLTYPVLRPDDPVEGGGQFMIGTNTHRHRAAEGGCRVGLAACMYACEIGRLVSKSW